MELLVTTESGTLMNIMKLEVIVIHDRNTLSEVFVRPAGMQLDVVLLLKCGHVIEINGKYQYRQE